MPDGVGCRLDDAPVGPGGGPVGRGVTQLGETGRAGIVETDDARSTGLFDEPHEGRLEPVEAAVVLEMIGLDVGDDHPVSVELDERPVALVGLDDEHAPAADGSSGPEIPEVAAHDERRVEARGPQRRGEHRRGRGLAVRAGDRDRLPRRGDRGQDLGPSEHRDPPTAGLDELRVVVGNGGRVRDDVDVANVLRPMADPHLGSGRAEAVDDHRATEVGATDGVAGAEEDLGDGAHPRPADPEDVDALGRSEVDRHRSPIGC